MQRGCESYESEESGPDIESTLETLHGAGADCASRYSHRDDHAAYPDAAGLGSEDEDADYDDPREHETAYYTSVSAFASAMRAGSSGRASSCIVCSGSEPGGSRRG